MNLCQKEKYSLINNLPSSLRVCALKGCTAHPINKHEWWITPHVAFVCACVVCVCKRGKQSSQMKQRACILHLCLACGCAACFRLHSLCMNVHKRRKKNYFPKVGFYDFLGLLDHIYKIDHEQNHTRHKHRISVYTRGLKEV